MTKKPTMMDQWQSCKAQAPGALLFFRLGDFYEAFYEDAHILSKETHVTLTQRQGIPMAGIPQQNLDLYLDRLISKGHKVAIAEQVESAKEAKGLVERKVVRVVTPATVVSSTLISDQHNNFFASLAQHQQSIGLALLDVTTSEFKVVESDSWSEIVNELHKFRPKELLISKKTYKAQQSLFEELLFSFAFTVTEQEEWAFDLSMTTATLKDQFKVFSLEGFGLKEKASSVMAAGALLFYLKESLSLPLSHITLIKTYEIGQWLRLDRTTQRNLELVTSLQEQNRKGTLLELLDHTYTPMGARLLKQWILHPLLSLAQITARQEAIEELLKLPLGRLASILAEIKDLERLIMRISTGFCLPRDLVALKNSLVAMEPLKEVLSPLDSARLQELLGLCFDGAPLAKRIELALVNDPPNKVGEGTLFRQGYDSVLDEWMTLSNEGKDWVVRYQAQLREETGIKTLRVNDTQAFGYFIEVSRSAASQMPSSFTRRQTLVNAERFTSPELKAYEEKLLQAQEQLNQRQHFLFNALLADILPFALAIKELAAAVAEIDGLYSLATVARKWHYTRPVVDNSSLFSIVDGRHPVVEAQLTTRSFTPNDLELDQEKHLIVLTGPNMAGKSTYLRQIALIALLAHMGSFVPAKSAHIGLVDQIFTRIGASDDLARGQSTFMVEMTETANILHHATVRSLLVLDEIGRGTSTYDGISIASAIAEYLLTEPSKRAKVLFATHYWELTSLQERFPGAINFHVAVSERNGSLHFLHKVLPNSMEKSYGIHVAKLAGLPRQVIQRAQELLINLEDQSRSQK